MSDFTQNPVLIKSVSAGVIAGLLDKFAQGPAGNTSVSAVFGASVGAGIMITSLITNQIPQTSSSGMTTGVLGRALEIGGTSAGSYLLYTKGGEFFLNANTRKPDFDFKKLGIVVVADLAGEFMKNWFLGAPATLF